MGSVRDEEIRTILTEANPWWRAAAAGHAPVDAVRSHRLIRDRARHDLGYRPSILNDLATGTVGDSLVVLTGHAGLARASPYWTSQLNSVAAETSDRSR